MGTQPHRSVRDWLIGLVRSRPPDGCGTVIAATGVLAVGKGIFLTTLVVYLLQIARFNAVQASICISLWGIAAVMVSLPTGALVDRYSGRLIGLVAAALAAPLV